MSGKLRIDTDEVTRVSTNLQTIVSRLNSAGADSSTLSDMIPVRELANTVDDFAGQWDDRRKNLVEEVTALQQQAQAVADAFDSVDSQLVDALTRPPETAAPSGGGPTAV